MQPEELSESEIIMVNGKSDGDKKDGGIPEEVIPRKQITSKELSEIFCNIGSAKDKMQEADPNGNMTVHEGTEKLFCNVSHMIEKKKKKASTVQTTLGNFFINNKTKYLNSLFLMFYILVN